MRVQFEATLEEVVDVQMRSMARSAVARRWRRRSTLIFALFVGLTVFLLTHSRPLLVQLPLALAGAGLAVLLYPRLYQRSAQKRLRQLAEQYLGGAATVEIQVELAAEGMRVHQRNTDLLFPWADVEQIEQTEAGVEVVSASEGLLVVRRRAFASDEEIEQFLALAQQYQETAPG